MLNINQVKTFIKVVDEGSLSGASDKMGLTQPAVTLHIQNLEDYFGVGLLSRKGRNIEMTPQGKILYEQGRDLLRLYDEIEDRIFDRINRQKNKIIIGAGPIMADYVIPHIIALFRKSHPAIDICVDSSETNAIVKGVLDHSYDIGFVGFPVKNSKLCIKEWVKDELLLIVPVNHPFIGRTDISIEELLEQEFIWRKEVTGIRMFFKQALKQKGFSFPDKPFTEASSSLSVLTSVHAGLGISLISRCVAQSYIETGMIASVSVTGLNLTRNLYIITHGMKRLIPVVQEFIAIAKEYRT